MNELEDIKTLFAGTNENSRLDLPGVLKKVIACLPKRTKDKFTEILCNACIVMPSFDYLLRFVEKQLKLISHPLMQNNISNVNISNDFDQTNAEKKRSAKPVVLNRGGILYFQGGNYQWFPTGGPQSDFWGSMSLFMEKMKEYVIVKAVVDIRGGE